MTRTSLLDRVGALTGLVAGALFAAGAILGDPYNPATDPDPSDPANVLANALIANRDQARLGAYLALAGVFFLLWFVARLSIYLRTPRNGGEWLASVAYGAGLLTGGALLMDIGFGLAASELSHYGADAETAKVLFLWGWNSATLLAAPLGALVFATTLASFRPGAFPIWFRWFGVLIVAVLLVLTISGTPGLAAVAGTAWMMVASAALSLRVGSPTTAGTTEPAGGKNTGPELAP